LKRNWKISNKEIVIIVNRRDSLRFYEEITRFDPNFYWREFNLKRIHSFYLDIKSIKNLKRELPPIITYPLDCILEKEAFPMSQVRGDSFMNVSMKSSEISTIHISSSKEKEEMRCCSLSDSHKTVKSKPNCLIF